MPDWCGSVCFLLVGLAIVWIVFAPLPSPPPRWLRTPVPRPNGNPPAPPPPPTPRPPRAPRPYPVLVRGTTGGETRRARLTVQRNPEASAIYHAVAADPADVVSRGALADWLEERGFPGAAENMRNGVK